jgi:ferric-dicitrate binding protein FerR (iron transport regulator)
MTRVDAHKHESSAERLGRLARVLDGSVSAAENAAARDRLLMALETRRAWPKHWLSMSAAAAVLLVGVVAGTAAWMYRAKKVEYRLAGSSLQIQNEWLSANRESGYLRFSEGSEFELALGSKSRVADLRPNGARVVLASGTLRARVAHRPRSRWSVSAGPYVVEVTGTVFEVDWSDRARRLEVRLREGGVTVRGPSLQGGVRVTAGQRLVAQAQTGKVELSPLTPVKIAREPRSVAAEPMPEPPAKPSDQPQSVAPSRPAPSWSALVTGGNFRGVLAQAQSRGVEATLKYASLADLAAFADAARYSGERSLARRALLAQRARFASSAEARAAAFLLGRIADDQGAADEALHWYEVYLRYSPDGAFGAEALGRTLVVVVRSGDDQEARALADRYLRRFPHGAHASYAREVLQRP